jgi:hypothetical protein
MRTKISSFLLMCFILLSCSIFAHSLPERNGFEKLYLESGTVQITPQGIFLDLNGDYMQIYSISQDEKGPFVIARSDQVSMVTCKRCGKNYDEDNQSNRCPHGWLVHH